MADGAVLIDGNGAIFVNMSNYDADAVKFFRRYEELGCSFSIEFMNAFDKYTRNIKGSVQNLTNPAIIRYKIGDPLQMPTDGEVNEVDGDSILNVLTDNRTKGRSIALLMITGAPVFAGYVHDASDENDNQIDLTALGGVRTDDYVILFLN